MKLSFYTGGWPNISWSDACKTAADMEMQGVELLYSKVEAAPLLEGTNAGSNRRKFVRAFNEAAAAGIGVFTVDGKMVDLAFIPGAQRTLKLAKACGMYEGDLV